LYSISKHTTPKKKTSPLSPISIKKRKWISIYRIKKKGKGKAEPLTIDCEFMNVLGFFDLLLSLILMALMA
jgi:hypothetical protein